MMTVTDNKPKTRPAQSLERSFNSCRSAGCGDFGLFLMLLLTAQNARPEPFPA